MLLAPVDYYRPDSLAESLEALSDDVVARPLAGGQSLISLLKLRALSVDLLVDISRLAELQLVEARDDGSVEIGAGVTYDEIARSETLRRLHPRLCQVASFTVDAQVRNRGTFGGNLCHNDPINDFPPLAVALDATFHLASHNGERDLGPEEFFTGYFETATRPDELLRSVSLPPLADGYRVGYYDVEIGEAAARAVAVVKTEDGHIADSRVVLGCLPTPVRRREVEAALQGAPATADAVAQATAAAADGLEFLSDADASADYRRSIAPVVAKRAVMQAIDATEQGDDRA